MPILLTMRASCDGGGKGALLQINKSATLSCCVHQTLFEPACVAAFNQGQNAQYDFSVEKELAQTLVARGPGAVAVPYGVYSTSHNSFHCVASLNVANTLTATDYKDPPICTEPCGTNPGYQNGVLDLKYRVRRLTPTECARLQGFADWWCDDLSTPNPNDADLSFWRKVWNEYCAINGKKAKTDKQIKTWLQNPYSESAEYKMWGNGVALPCVWFVLAGIKYYFDEVSE